MENCIVQSSDSRIQQQRDKISKISNGRYTLIRFQIEEKIAIFYDNKEQKEFKENPRTFFKNLKKELTYSQLSAMEPDFFRIQVKDLIDSKKYDKLEKIKEIFNFHNEKTSFFEEIQKYCQKNRFIIMDEFINCDVFCYFYDDLRNSFFYTTPNYLLFELKRYYNEYGDCDDFYFKFERHGSKGEKNIEKYLIKNNYYFIREYSFEDLKDKGTLRFDFAIFRTKKDFVKQVNPIILIEFDGIQHQKPVEHFGGVDGFEERQKKDIMKNDYALKNKMKLIRLTNPSFQNIEKVLNKKIRGKE